MLVLFKAWPHELPASCSASKHFLTISDNIWFKHPFFVVLIYPIPFFPSYCLDCCCVCAPSESPLMTHLCQEVLLVIECYSETQKRRRRSIFTSTATLKTVKMSSQCSSKCQQSDATTTLNPKLICPHRIWCGPVGWEERTSNCVLFLPPASQTVALTKYPFCAISFHSDWTNWDLLTANPIRAGTSQSRLGICHPRHTGLPLPS